MSLSTEYTIRHFGLDLITDGKAVVQDGRAYFVLPAAPGWCSARRFRPQLFSGVHIAPDFGPMFPRSPDCNSVCRPPSTPAARELRDRRHKSRLRS